MKQKRSVLHLISQAHLDPVWLWPVRDGMAEALTTMSSAVDRAAETPAFRFTRSSACTYRWAKETDPRLFREIKKLVKSGRWEVVGGWIEQPDCNLPSTESLFRQGLHAKAFFTQEFGPAGNTRIGYNVDSFGHAGGFPQILKQSGFDYYVFMRPQPHDRVILPLLFWWQSPDGSRVLAQRIPIQYSQSPAATPDTIESVVRASVTEGFAPGFRHGVMFFGVGNHGGGPTKAHIERILALQKDPSLPELRFSTLQDYFACVEKDPAFGRLPVVGHELQYVFRGCYAADGAVKAQHRAAEKALYAAEALQTMHLPSAQNRLHDAWWRFGFNQFHDILAGTCVAGASGETKDRFGSVITDASEAVHLSTCSLARRVDTSGERGSVLFVANPLPWARKAFVQFDTFITPDGGGRIVELESKDGLKFPVQWMRADANFGPWGIPWGKLAAVVEVPAMGHRVLRVVRETPTAGAGADQMRTGATSEQFVKTGSLAPAKKRRFIKQHALRQLPGLPKLLTGAIDTVVLTDKSGTWGHGVESYNEFLGRPRLIGTEVLEDGCLVRIERQKSRFGKSEIWMDVVRFAHTPAIELRLRFNWQEQRRMLKLEIPTLLNPARVVAKTCGGVTMRPVSGNEEPCQDWIVLEGVQDGAPASLLLINDSSYSYDVQGGILRMALARGVPHAEHPPFECEDDRNSAFLDQGWQERRFLVGAAPGRWAQFNPDRLAQEFQIPAPHMLDSAHAGTHDWDGSCLQISPANVAVLATKPPEQGSGLILRVQEMAGRRTTARGSWQGLSFDFPLKAWEIRTLRLAVNSQGLVVTPSPAVPEAASGR